jgi:leucine dehydrogenase
MPLFKVLEEFECESLSLIKDNDSGLQAVIAIHNTRRGPAFGGIRTLSYATTNAAVSDAVRLAQAMSFKAAVADLPAGGGKTVVIKNPSLKRAEAFQALGRAIERFGGNYFTGLDVGTTREDLLEIGKETRHVASELDFGKATARGVFAAIRVGLVHQFGDDKIEGRSFAVQGLGAVGAELVTMLHAAGGEIFVADTDERQAVEVAERMSCEVLGPGKILTANVDVIAPCALGSIFTAQSVETLNCKVIAGAANNQLASPAAGKALNEAGITFVPDYVANAGALIKGVTEHVKGEEVGFDVVDRIYDNALGILERAAKEGRTTDEVAQAIAKERLK